MSILPVFVKMKEDFSQYDSDETDVILLDSTDEVLSDSSDDERESFDGWLVDGE